MVSVYLEPWVKSTIYSNMEGGDTPALWSDISPSVRPTGTQQEAVIILDPPVCLQTQLHDSDLTHAFLSNCHKSSVVRWRVCTLLLTKKERKKSPINLSLRSEHLQKLISSVWIFSNRLFCCMLVANDHNTVTYGLFYWSTATITCFTLNFHAWIDR